MHINFSPFPELITQRLLLRQLSLNDSEKIFALRSDEVVNKYLNRTAATSVEEAKAFINKINFGIQANQSVYWAICFRDQPELVGTICLWNFSEKENKAEIGYELLPQFHGKGIMQEAFLKVVEYGFQTLELSSIEAWTTVQNNGSKKILERNHFQRNAELEKKIDRSVESPECIVYSLSRETFKQQVAV